MQTFVLVASAMGLVIVGAVAAWVFLNSKKEQAVDQTQNIALDELKKTIAALQAQMSSDQIQIREHLANQMNVMRGSFENSSRAVSQEAKSFTEKFVEMSELLKRVREGVQNVESFQEIFKSPKLRGTWGEASLEHLLSQYYPKELYELQYMFSSNERADAIFKLPDGRMIAIDSKFPAENFVKLVEANGDAERETSRKNFVQDVKARIDEIATKYILPSENTLDYAMMYVPAEAVYYEMINPASALGKDDMVGYAWNKKVVITSPNQLYLHLKTIEHWFRDVQMSKQTHEIIKQFGKIRKDGDKLADDFRLLGKHLGNAQSAFDSSEKRVGMLVNKVDQLTKGKLDEEPLLEAEKQEE